MGKISSYTSDTSPTLSDYILGNQASGPTTSRFLLSKILTLLGNQSSSTLLSSSLTTYSNPGTVGGTFYYINLGGIKLLWGNTSQHNSHNSPSYGLTYPAGFFNTVQFISMTAFDLGTDVPQFANSTDVVLSNSSLTVVFNSVANSAGAQMAASIFVIGT